MNPESVFFVTTSPYGEWVTCTPTAFLGIGNHFSGSLSGIEPLFPDTCCHHGRQVTYSRKLIEQIYEGPIADAKLKPTLKKNLEHICLLVNGPKMHFTQPQPTTLLADKCN
ncbi:hypothetical protein ACTXT7_014777 [Hymenolepis weldensis]